MNEGERNPQQRLQRQDALLGIGEEVGHSTNAWKALRHLREGTIAVDRIVVFTGMQIRDSRIQFSDDANTIRKGFDAYREAVAPEASLYMIDLASYGDLVTPEGYEEVYNISGWSENVLEFIEHAEKSRQVIDEIDTFGPWRGFDNS